MEGYKRWIQTLVSGEPLREADAFALVSSLIEQNWPPLEQAALLTAWATRGEQTAELVGAARALQAGAAPFAHERDFLVDTCGTGGDGKSTPNVSTMASLVVAAGGIAVAKHGNRASSSAQGSADFMEKLGIAVDAPTASTQNTLAQLGFAFLFAPRYHPGVRHVAAVRRELGFRTLFNLLGPLVNPARPTHQVVGVFAEKWIEPLAQVLVTLGVRRATVVHGQGGYDEFSPDQKSYVAIVNGNSIQRAVWTPEDFGLTPQPFASASESFDLAATEHYLRGGSPEAINSVLMTAAAIFHLSERGTLKEGTRWAQETLASGKVWQLVENLRTLLPYVKPA